MILNSLRARLIVIILGPLLVISIAAGVWQFGNATKRAEEIFDRGLLSAALAITRDMSITGGDALTPATRSLISNTSGGEVFYHVFAPDGVFVTGYATPPVLSTDALSTFQDPKYSSGIYQRRGVRVLRVQDTTKIGEVTGLFTVTVWQNADVRRAFVQDVLMRSFGVIALLIGSVALVVWFGVNLGLRPLLDLQDAIAKRSPSELEPIKRNVPIEIRDLVATLNTLLDRVSRRISSKDEFISNAAHQMRNPIAGVLALAESVQSAPTEAAMKRRSAELVSAARDASHLTNQLLSFERAKGTERSETQHLVNFTKLVGETLNDFTQNIAPKVQLLPNMPKTDIFVMCDPLMMREALRNLLHNAIHHGGPDMDEVTIQMDENNKNNVVLNITDNGIGISDSDHALVLNRFGQAGVNTGSGLGLPIAKQVIENMGGEFKINGSNAGFSLTISIPKSTTM